MIVSIIVAQDQAGGIGMDGRMPWHLREDLQRFKALTMGHHLIMGRVTYESIDRILSGRTMIVVTRREDYHALGCLVVHTVDDALAVARSRGETEVFIIGGAQIYAQTLHLADRIYLTQVHTQTASDVFFPEFDRREWSEIERQDYPADQQNDFPSTFSTLIRKVDA